MHFRDPTDERLRQLDTSIYRSCTSDRGLSSSNSFFCCIYMWSSSIQQYSLLTMFKSLDSVSFFVFLQLMLIINILLA